METGPRYWWAKIKADAADVAMTIRVVVVASVELLRRFMRGK